MKTFLLTIAFAIALQMANAQISYSVLPVNKQVYPRNKQTGNGTILISGKAAKSSGFTSIKVEKYRLDQLQSTLNQTLTFSGDSAAFSFDMPIKAELAEYFIKVYGVKNNQSVLNKSIDSLLSGDAFIIQGQSNAVANKYEGTANGNASQYIRVWGSAGNYDKEWFYADGDAAERKTDVGNAGQWGLRLARHIMDVEKIPVVIYNGARGGMPVRYFLPKPNTKRNNYRSLLQRVTESGFINNIRAIFWYQGESDSNVGNSVNAYKNTFDTLYTSWKLSYPSFEKLYIIQVKPSCAGDAEASAVIQEAQRQLADSIPNASIMATHGIKHYESGFWCHYPYDSGYKLIGDYLYLMINRDLHDIKNAKNVESPQVTSVVQTAANKLTLTFKNEGDTYLWEAGTEKDFVLNGISAKVASGEVKGSTLVLTLNKNIQASLLSFYGHMVGGSPTLRNASGQGIVGFYKMPVTTASVMSKTTTGASNINDMQVSPNPSVNYINITYKLATAQSVIFRITDNTGRILIQMKDENLLKGNHQKTIQTSSLKTGTYTLQIVAGNEQLSRQFVKQ